MQAAPRIRPAARAVVTDPDGGILLVHFHFPWDETLPHGLWSCPGGGIDAGESKADGLVRELREELGLVITDPGPPIWWKEHLFPMDRWDGQRDTYFWVPVEAFEPHPELTDEELLSENVDAVRWWSYDELQAAQAAYDRGDVDDTAYTILSPRRLGHLVTDLLSHGRPDELHEIEPV